MSTTEDFTTGILTQRFLNFLSDTHWCKVIWFLSAFHLKLFTLVNVISITVKFMTTPWRSRLFPGHPPCRNQSCLVYCGRTFSILLITHFGQMSPPCQLKHCPTILFDFALQRMSTEGEHASSSGSTSNPRAAEGKRPCCSTDSRQNKQVL